MSHHDHYIVLYRCPQEDPNKVVVFLNSWRESDLKLGKASYPRHPSISFMQDCTASAEDVIFGSTPQDVLQPQ